MSINWRLHKYVVVPYNGVLHGHKKGGNSDTGCTMDESWEHHTQGKKLIIKIPQIVQFHFYEMSRIGKYAETASKWVAARGWGEAEWGVTASGLQVSLGGNENNLEMDSCITSWIY